MAKETTTIKTCNNNSNNTQSQLKTIKYSKTPIAHGLRNNQLKHATTTTTTTNKINLKTEQIQ